MSNDASSVLVDGPWEHRFVAANGARFHVAVAGEGPLVLLLHGFPQFWYAWHHQLPALAEAGYQAVAVDLRGFGASDKPPKGYDTYTSTADAAALVRSLGHERAVVAGQGLGGWIAWSMPALQPQVTAGVAALSMPHPIVMQRAGWRNRAQRRVSRYLLDLQWPFVAERRFSAEAGDREVHTLLSAWAGPGGPFPTDADVRRYAGAMALPFVAHSAAEYYRWIGRNQVRLDGPLFNRRVGEPIVVPVLHLQGSADGCVLAPATGGSQAFVRGRYTDVLVEGAGHFLAEQAPDRVTAAMLAWLGALSPA
ncbi:MAG: alpha/beta hydrolase [Dermatophilaceae bacterium]